MVKRWSNGQSFCTVQRCRRCGEWKREDIAGVLADRVVRIQRITVREEKSGANGYQEAEDGAGTRQTSLKSENSQVPSIFEEAQDDEKGS